MKFIGEKTEDSVTRREFALEVKGERTECAPW